MITKIEALNYRCLRYVSQELGDFHVLAGPNASGKSTFLDVVAFMADVLNKGPLQAVGERASDYQELFWMREGQSFELAVESAVPEDLRARVKNKDLAHCRYELTIGVSAGSGEMGILAEKLLFFKDRTPHKEQVDLFPRSLRPPRTICWPLRKKGARTLINKVPGGNDNFYSETGGWDHVFRLGPQKSALASLPEDVERFPVSTWFKKMLSQGAHVLMLNSKSMRFPSPAWMPKRLRPDGSNLPWVVQDLQTEDHARFQQWLEHVRTGLPHIERIATVEREEDRSRYLILRYAAGSDIPSWLVSDGTLRFLALTLLPYLKGMRDTYLIEEPENGIHPRAVEAVHQSLSSVYEGQVLLATHSPIFLSLSKLSQILCFAVNEQGAVDVVEGTRHPRLTSWRHEVPLGDLFAAGVLE